ncbi:MAG TPA: hypothetical protein VF203_01495 [Burkholderiales bacterium]
MTGIAALQPLVALADMLILARPGGSTASSLAGIAPGMRLAPDGETRARAGFKM